MSKLIIGVFLGVLLAGIALFFLKEEYIRYTSEYETTKRAEAAKQKKQDAADFEKRAAESRALVLCRRKIQEHHGGNVKEQSIARNTATFAAINYSLSNRHYHARCIVSDKQGVTDFTTNAI